MKNIFISFFLFIVTFSYSQEKFLLITSKRTTKVKLIKEGKKIVVKNNKNEKIKGKLGIIDENTISIFDEINNKKMNFDLSEIKYIKEPFNLSTKTVLVGFPFLIIIPNFFIYNILFSTSISVLTIFVLKLRLKKDSSNNEFRILYLPD